jgi:hypothetical protein
MGKMMIAKYQSKCATCDSYIRAGAWMLWNGTAQCETCAKSKGWARNYDARTKRVIWWAPVAKDAQIAAKVASDRIAVAAILRGGLVADHRQIADACLCTVDFVNQIAREIA